MPTITDAAAKRVVSAVLENLFAPSGRTFALRFWDGTLQGPKASFEPRFTLVLRRAGVLKRMLMPAHGSCLGRSFIQRYVFPNAEMSLPTLTRHSIAQRYNVSCGGRRLMRESEVFAQVRWTGCQKWRRRATRYFRP